MMHSTYRSILGVMYKLLSHEDGRLGWKSHNSQPNQELKVTWTVKRKHLKMYLMCCNLNEQLKMHPYGCQN